MFKKIITKYPQLAFLAERPFTDLPEENLKYLRGLIEDALFWVEQEKKPHSGDGFKFLTATYGLVNAQEEAKEKGLAGKAREKFLRPHQDLYTMFNPYSGNSRE